jgi:hypothetical protein
MTQEKFNRASKIQEEINRLNLLIKYIENKDEKDFTDTMELAFNMSSDFLYLVHLLGADDVLGFMRTRKKMLEKEFEEL